MQTEAFTPDPLLYDFELPLRRVYHPLGFSVQISTNSHLVLAGAEESWGCFRKTFSEPLMELRIGVVKGDSEQCPPTPICRGYRNLLTQTADAENFAVADVLRAFAFAWLTQAAVENKAYLRYHFLEGTVWNLLESLYLTSIHGACVKLGGHGVLLCGDSGAGKSSLSYACVRNGWIFLSDDSSCLIRGRSGRVVTGNPFQMRFRKSAIELFPELKYQRMTPRLSGEMAIELATASLPYILTTTECTIDYIVFLNRREPQPGGLSRFPKEKALAWFEEGICYGETWVREARLASLSNLLTAEVFELRYADLDSAVRQLEGLVRDGAKPAVGSQIAVGKR